ncbi:MAG: hypothetical protein IKP47_02525, partial [Ruminococcus sp.]|nr:hypothetical protein [Ruminococcus sp.]
IIRLHIFRHITQILLALRQQGGVEFRQSDEKSDCASDAQWLCGVALIVQSGTFHARVKILLFNKTLAFCRIMCYNIN